MADLTFTSIAKSFDYGHSQMIGVKLSRDNDVTGIIYSVDDSRETLTSGFFISYRGGDSFEGKRKGEG